MSRRVRARSLAASALVGCALVGSLPAPSAWAAAGDITTVAGGRGSGPALSVGQDPVAVAASGGTLWVVDGVADPVLRTIDLSTGQESFPVMSVPEAFGFHPTQPNIAGDGHGNVYVAYNDPNLGGLVAMVTPAGRVTTLAGGGRAGLAHLNQIRATAERLGTLNGIAVGPNGSIYISENSWSDGRFTTTVTDSRIRRIDPDGKIYTSAGTGRPGFSGDGGSARLAKLSAPLGLVTDPAGVLFIADSGNARIREVSTSGTIATFAGGGTSTADNVSATSASLSASYLTYDGSGVVLSDSRHCVIRRVVHGQIATLVGDGTCGYDGDGGSALAAQVFPTALAATSSGLAFVQPYPGFAGASAGVLRVVDPGGIVHRLAGTGSTTYGGDGGPALQAQFANNAHPFVDAAGDIYLTDGPRVRRIDPSGTITTVAGSVVMAANHDTGDGGPATQATFRNVTAVAAGPDGDLYILDNGDFRIRRVDAAGIITTVAGTGIEGQTGDGGPATAAELGNPAGLAFDAAGDLVFGDGCLVRMVDPQGTITTVAGSDPCAESGDGGPASAAKFGLIKDVATDSSGGIDIAEVDLTGSPQVYRVRRIDSSGVVSTIAGGGALTADGVPATQASIEADAIRLDNLGRLVIVDTTDGLVRRVETDGTIHTVAGGGTGGDGGPATVALLQRPTGVAVDGAGDLFISCTDTRTPFGGGALREVAAA